LPQPPYPQPPAAAHPQPACGLRAWPTMGDACMSPGAKLEAGLGRVESVEAQGLLPPDAAAKARDALVAEYTKSLFTAGNASGGGGGGVSNATVGARAAPPAHSACDAEDQCAAETLSSRFTRPSKSPHAAETSKSAQQTTGASTRDYGPWTILGEFSTKSAASSFLKQQNFALKYKDKVRVNLKTRKGEPTGNVYVCQSHVGCTHQIRTRPPKVRPLCQAHALFFLSHLGVVGVRMLSVCATSFAPRVHRCNAFYFVHPLALPLMCLSLCTCTL
jgi:hypothetical protein